MQMARRCCRSAARRGWCGPAGGVNWANQAGAWRRVGGGAPSLLPPLPVGPALTGGPARTAGKCRRRRCRPPPQAWGGSPGAPRGWGCRSTSGERRGRVLSVGWSPEAAPARPGARVSLGRGGGRRGLLSHGEAREPASGGEYVPPSPDTGVGGAGEEGSGQVGPSRCS